MNFIGAIAHAIIGYGIRRKAWQNENSHRAVWYHKYLHLSREHNKANTGQELVICGTDRKTAWLDLEDYNALDWEIV